MLNSGISRLSNRTVAALFRAAVDLCWLVPAVHLLELQLHNTETAFVVASLLVPALYGSVVLHLRPSPSSRDMALFIFAAIWVGMSWWLHNRGILIEGIIGEAFSYALLTLLLFGVSVERGLRSARAIDAQAKIPMIVYSTTLTAIILLALHFTHDYLLVWPVLLLPLCLVGSSVASRAHIIAPSSDARQLGWRSRWIIIAALVIVPFTLALVLIGMSTPGFWTMVGTALFRVWATVSQVIVYIAYPFAYIGYLLYRLIKPLVPEDLDPGEMEPAEPPDMDEFATPEDPLLGGVLTIIMRLLILAIAAGVIVWIMRSLRNVPATDEETQWEEERTSLWDPDEFNQRVRDFLRGREESTPQYRTRTERIVRQLFREFARDSSPRVGVSYPPHWTPRMFCVQVIRSARATTSDTGEWIGQLLQGYETVRYGPPVEREDIVQNCREAGEKLRQSPPERAE